MSLNPNDLYSLLVKQRGVGEVVLNTAKFLFDNTEKPLEFFKDATTQGQLKTRTVGILVQKLNERVRKDTEDSLDREIFLGAEKTLTSQFSRWEINPLVATVNSPDERTNRIIYLNASSSSNSINSEEFVCESLKVLNCLCEFYFGDRMLSGIIPANDYRFDTLADFKALQEQYQAFPDSKKVDTNLEAQIQLLLCQDSFWKCDLEQD